LTSTPFPRIPDQVQVCRNCARSMKQVIAFNRHHGFDLLTGELRPGRQPAPQAGSETPAPPPGLVKEPESEEEPPSPPAKQARKAR
jgi:hypothetical protein